MSNTKSLTTKQRDALRTALKDGKVVQENWSKIHRQPTEAARRTLHSLDERGLLTRDDKPHYMPSYVLTDAGRALAETL